MLLKSLLSADIKGFLADVKPALLSALDAEYEKNPFEVMPSQFSEVPYLIVHYI